MNESRRLKMVLINPQKLYDWMRPIEVEDGIFRHLDVAREVPRDANLVNVHFSYEYHAFQFLFEHPSFDEVPEGERIPILRTTYKTERYVRESDVESIAACPDFPIDEIIDVTVTQ